MIRGEVALGLVAGALFATGLVLAGVASPGTVLDAFRLDDGWDPRLWLMFAGSLAVQVPATRWIVRRGRTLTGARLPVRPARRVDARLVTGAIVFGAGWGLAGVCPGPAFTIAASGALHAALAFAGLWVGIAIHDRRGASSPRGGTFPA